jgi:nucleoside-diphosphate-sugar epimerase
MRKVLDVGKIQGLGWKAKTSLKEGINLTYKIFSEPQL